jgi:YbaB/EbfC DNA-binding family
MSDWQQEVAATAARYQRLQDRLSRVSITETSEDGSVKVTVDTNGLLTGLELVDHGTPFAEVARQVMRCMRRAQARVPQVLEQAMAEEVGSPDVGTHLLLADTRKRFPQPPERAPAAAPRTGGEDDWGDRPILHDI